MVNRSGMAPKTTVGIIGFGRFSQLMIRYLSEDCEVTVYDRRERTGDISRLGGHSGSLAAACACDIVIPAVPISAMKPTLTQIGPRLKPHTLVVDICSVKTYPVQWMLEILPANVDILATHPMFGPDSAAVTLAGQKIILCPQRIDTDKYACIRNYLLSCQLVVIETTPEAHDRQIAATLALTHFIGRSLAEYGAEPLDIDTDGYKRLLYTLETVTHDTWQLFTDMHHYNPYTKDIRDRFVAAARRINARLDEGRVTIKKPEVK